MRRVGGVVEISLSFLYSVADRNSGLDPSSNAVVEWISKVVHRAVISASKSGVVNCGGALD